MSPSPRCGPGFGTICCGVWWWLVWCGVVSIVQRRVCVGYKKEEQRPICFHSILDGRTWADGSTGGGSRPRDWARTVVVNGIEAREICDRIDS